MSLLTYAQLPSLIDQTYIAFLNYTDGFPKKSTISEYERYNLDRLEKYKQEDKQREVLNIIILASLAICIALLIFYV